MSDQKHTTWSAPPEYIAWHRGRTHGIEGGREDENPEIRSHLRRAWLHGFLGGEYHNLHEVAS